MKKTILLLTILISNLLASSQEVKYTIANNDWNPDSLGNHRVILHFYGNGNVARTIIQWRRRDTDPWNKRLIVVDAKTNEKIDNIRPGVSNNEKTELWFEPTSGPGDYYVYYMPYKNEKSNYPKGIYLASELTTSIGWLGSISAKVPVNTTVKEIQSINALNSFYPMEITATVKETAALISKSKRSDMLVFPEDRNFPVKMTNSLPYRWIQKGIRSTFSGEASRGENYTYQLAVYPLQHIEGLTVTFSALKDGKGNKIDIANSYCFNTSGVDYTGKPFTKTLDLPANKVQSLWCGIDVPQNIPPGLYTGKAMIITSNTESFPVNIQLTVTGNQVADGNIAEPWKQTRLKWLNSTMAQENTVIAPYTAIEVKENAVSLLGRKLVINKDGFPSQIQTFYTEEMTGYQTTPNEILADPVQMIALTADGKNIEWKSGNLEFTKKEPGTVEWNVTNQSNLLQMQVNASLEFDGFVSYTVKITALSDVQLNGIGMEIPFTKAASTYMMGLGQKGGNMPHNFNWKWEVATKNQDGAWIGSVNAGLQFSLRDERYIRPLNTNFYLQKPLLLPSSWGNNNKGGISINELKSSTVVNNYSGDRKMKRGESLYYNFTLLITPFHTLDTESQWATRYYHKYDSPDNIKANGATVVNIHHATPINPWLNYPFIEYKKMKGYIDSAHALGLKVKIYNTVRELSNRAYETFPMRSLGHEIYSPGKGGGFAWLQEHVGDDYIPAWFVPEIKDAAIINSGMSRWHNYYVEGMNWLTQNVGVDGIYLDDVAFDRVTMKRIKRVLTRDGHPGIIDLHSANQYNKSDGFNNSANLYMEHFPYLNRLWFGEYFDYQNNEPDFFMTEVSGIPFGLMGEMLQDGGNPWRGMIYGMTNRFPWTEEADPRPIWKFWDEFGIKGSEMIGYWSSNCPVKTNNDKVLVTVYKKNDATLISLASWASTNTDVQLNIDWKKLGVDPSKAKIEAREIKNFQPARIFLPTESIPVEKGKGWLLIIK